MYKALAVVLALGSLATAGRAQTMATVTDQIMVMQMGTGESDTMDTHSIFGNGRFRTDSHSHGGMLAQIWGVNSSQLMVPGDSGLAMTILNHDNKTYFVFNPMGMFDSAGNIFGGAGGKIKLDPTVDSMTVDSLGPGPVIAGHATFHWRTHSKLRMSMAFMGQNTNVSTEMTSDMFIAPDIPADTSRAHDLGLLSASGGPMGSMGAKLGSGTARIAKKGTSLKMVSETVTQIGGMAQRQRMSIETLSYKKMVVPDSVFRIPADYKKTEGMFGMPPG